MKKTKQEDVMFPVEAQPIYRIDKSKRPVAIPGHQAIVNLVSGETVGVVGAGYRLVTNCEALGFAQDCARQLFGAAKGEELEVFNIYAPPTRQWCCVIDLIHKGYEINLFKREAYLPFLRVTNSYNGTIALRFDVGFCRKICSNGMIFEKQAIDFRFSHSRQQIGNRLEFSVGKDRLAELQRQFTSQADRLFNFMLPPGFETSLFFRAMGLPLPPSGDEKKLVEKEEKFAALKTEAENLIHKYICSLGGNGYALFNALTDFASHPPESVPNFRRSTPAMQATAGLWAREFAEELGKGEPKDLTKYLGDYARVADWKPTGNLWN